MSRVIRLIALALFLTVKPSPSLAQFVPRAALIPAELAALRIAPDRAAPTSAQLAQIRAIERQVRIDQLCNSTWDPAFEPPRRELLRLYESTYGPDHPATARPLLSLLCNFVYDTHLPTNTNLATARVERDKIVARLVSIGRKRAQPAILFNGLTAQSQLLLDKGKHEPAIAQATEALSLARQLFATDPQIIASSDGLLASALEAAGRITEAEPLRQDAVARQQAITSGDRFVLATAFEQLGNNLARQLRAADSHTWYSRALDIYQAALKDADAGQLSSIIGYSQKLYATDPARVEGIYRAVLARQESEPGSSDRRNWMTLWNLAKSTSLDKSARNPTIRSDLTEAIGYQRRVIAAIGPGQNNSFALEIAYYLSNKPETAAEAADIYRRALVDDPSNPQLIESLGTTLWILGRFDEALPMRKRSVAIATARYGPSHRETLRLAQNLGVALWINHRPREAQPYYEDVLAGYRAELSAIPETANADYRRSLSAFISSKASDLLKLYWTDRAAPGAGGEALLRAKGFAAAQLAHPSASSAAISETAARRLADRAGKDSIFAAWAVARDRVVALDAAISQAAQRGSDGDADRVRMLAERAGAGQVLAVAAAGLRRELPQLLATLRPEPVALNELMSGAGKSALLRQDEALILLYPGMPEARGEMSRGVAFAVTREGSAWAEIPIDGADLARLADELHKQLGDGANSGWTIRDPSEKSDTFLRYDRAAAYHVYQALFGDPAIAALLRNKTRWIIAPEGPLLALNFAALVSRSPPGGPDGDFDPAALRATGWLGLEHVVTIVPSVSALRAARLQPASAWATGKFYAMGDPAFRGVADPPPVDLPEPVDQPKEVRGGRVARVPTANAARLPRKSYYRGGAADLAMLGQLPRLDATAAEVRRMSALLGAAPDRQFVQLAATQAQLEKSSLDGTLADSGVVLFATHALIDGDFDGTLAEPALALTPKLDIPVNASDDGLLTASEVAQLRFKDALVILSACDTASGASGGDGFSGLTRAFLLAGARAVLATYSPVLDAVGGRLTTTAVARLGNNQGDIASALRDAMHNIAADVSGDTDGRSLAHPFAWAVYVAIDPS